MGSIDILLEDGRNVAYPKGKNPRKETLDKVETYNTLSNYSFGIIKVIKIKEMKKRKTYFLF